LAAWLLSVGSHEHRGRREILKAVAGPEEIDIGRPQRVHFLSGISTPIRHS
jgi:hypothetical protein